MHFILVLFFVINVQCSTVKNSLFGKSKMPTKEPLLIRAARGEAIERVPIWIMRQAGM